MMVFTMTSLAAGCRRCQAHGAYGLDRVGVPLEKIQALWSYQSVDWARDNLETLRWDISKHTGAVHEQRTGPPGS
jgi:hypothetical protein